MAKQGYEAIPDVEEGAVGMAQSAKAKYPELDDDQADLIFSFDEAIAGSSVDLPIMPTSPDDLVSQGKGFIQSIVTPTLTSICTAAFAFYVSTLEDVGPYIEAIFPYVNATIVFASSVAPMKARFMSAAAPIFEQVNRVQEKVDRSVQELGETFNSSLDTLQAKAEKVMEPIKPTIAKAQPLGAKIKQAYPDAELPDQDLDEEFNEMRELVQPKLDEAAQMLQLEESIPAFLRTPQNFFWYIVFPMLLIGFVVQLVAAWVTTSLATAAPQSTSAAVVAGGRMLQEAVQAVKDQAESLKDEAQEKVGQAQAEAQELRDSAHAEYEELHEQMQVNMDELHGQVESQFAGAKSMLMNVAVSYGLSLLQVGLAFLLSSPIVRAWIIDLLVRMMKAKAMHVLREKGVETAFEDVFQSKMTKTRETLLKVIGYSQKIASIVNVPGLSMFGGGGDGESPVKAIGGILSPSSDDAPDKKSKPGGLASLGRMFSGKSQKK
jgi:hypothetical protein